MTSTTCIAALSEVIIADSSSTPPRQAASASAVARRSKAIVCARQGWSLFKVTFLGMLNHVGSPSGFRPGSSWGWYIFADFRRREST